jgi:hypothetical protein
MRQMKENRARLGMGVIRWMFSQTKVEGEALEYEMVMYSSEAMKE